MLCALFVGRGYTRYVERRIAETEGFVAFLNHASQSISMYLTPPARLCEGFCCESLEKSGFLGAVRRNNSLSDAFSECSSRLSVGGEAKKLLSECFRDFGQGYKEQEIARTVRYCSGLTEILERERRDLVQNARMVTTLLLAGAAGIFILLL